MIKEFVRYELAVKLKELGFDEKCFCNWEESWSPEPEDEIRMVLTTDQTWLRPGWIRAPTFSQAFRWFREEYNQHSFIELVFEDEIRFDYVLYVNEDEDNCIDYGDGPFETYEDAELALLDKLIEIAEGIKSKK
jgi:hypothetical protein